MTLQLDPTISQNAARALRGGVMPHTPPPASPAGARVTLELEAPPDAGPEIIFSDPNREDEWRVAMQPAADGLWRAEILLPQEPTLLHYHFVLATGATIRERRQAEGQEKAMQRDPRRDIHRRSRSHPRGEETLVEKAVYGVWKDQDFRIAVFLPEGAPPEWARGQVFYQIFPDRFARAAQENPTFRRERTYSRESLHRDWGELPEIPPKGRDFFGGSLHGAIEKLDYLADLGVTCVYFTPIFESPSNHRYDASDYHRVDPALGDEGDLEALVREASARGIRVLLDGVFNHCSSESLYFLAAQQDKQSPYYRWFHFTRWPNEYLGWAGVRTMPELVECPEVEAFFFGPEGVAQRWLRLGTSGWRTDVTPWLSDDYWRRFRAAVRRAFPEAFLIAEDWADATKRLLGDTFDATMNYRFGWTLWGWAGGRLSPAELDDRLETLRRDTPSTHFHCALNLLDSHDTARALTILDGEKPRLKLAAALQFAYPGAPMLYAGDEAGQEGAFAEDSRRPFPWDSYDRDLHAWYRKLIHARRESPALSHGSVQTAWIDPRGGYAFLRQQGEEHVLAVFNSSTQPISAEIALPGAPDGPWADRLGVLAGAETRGGVLRVEIPALSAGYLSAS